MISAKQAERGWAADALSRVYVLLDVFTSPSLAGFFFYRMNDISH